MFIRLLFSLIALIPSLSLAYAPQGTIHVKLSTENELFPIYVPATQNKDSSFPSRYLSQLHEVLEFDLGYNGSTRTVTSTPALETAARSSHTSQSQITRYRDEGVDYVVLTEVSGDRLHTSVVSVRKEVIRNLTEVTLTGDLSEDRMRIHQVSDTIHEALFGTPGIASTRFLYTVRVRPSSDSSRWTSEVWESDYDGHNARQITHESALCVTPTYIPPSSQNGRSTAFLFVSYKTGQPKIYLANLRDGAGHRFSYLPGNQMMPAISKQRDKVLFISDVASNPDVYLQPFNPEMGAMGKPQQVFALRGATQGSPVFSPDGNKVAFVSNKDGPPRIYTMDIPKAGADVRRLRPTLLTKVNRENSAPAWSPDGTKIAYCAKTDGVRQIWVYDFVTGKEQQVTHGGESKENPSWAPNSCHIIFNSASEDRSELYLVNIKQSESVCLTTGPGEKRFPSWEPRIL